MTYVNANMVIKYLLGMSMIELRSRRTEVADAKQNEALAAGKILVKDSIADIFLQQILTRPAEFDVVATMNLNGDYISDALAAE